MEEDTDLAAAGDDGDLGDDEEEGGQPELCWDDPELVHIPAGYARAPAAADVASVAFFMSWCRVKTERAMWHFGEVTKSYPPGYTFRRAPFTHDAILDRSGLVRGMNLTSQLLSEGYWVHIVKDAQAPATSIELTPPQPSTPVRRNPRGGKRAAAPSGIALQE